MGFLHFYKPLLVHETFQTYRSLIKFSIAFSMPLATIEYREKNKEDISGVYREAFGTTAVYQAFSVQKKLSTRQIHDV